MATAPFDAAAYKETTRRQWEEAAAAWHRWGPTLEQWLGEATELMLDLAGVRDGSQVLDVAAGAGGQTLAAARRVGAGGRVLATDISSNILEYAAAQAREAGLANVHTHVVDAEELDVERSSFDAAISRLGLMYFPDKLGSLAALQQVLRDGGRVGAIVFAEAEANGFFSLPIAIVRRRAQLSPPPPGAPGPFSATGIGELLAEAGFRDVRVERLEAPLRLASARECVRFERESFGALHQMLAGLDAADQEEAWAEIEQELAQFEGPSGFDAPCTLLVAAGTK
jgi:SAM-dependent methyltransferase